MRTRPALTIRRYDADDAAAVEAGRQVLEAARRTDSPFLPPVSAFRRSMQVRHGWDNSPEVHLLGLVDGRPVAVADIELGEWDNRDLAWFTLVVDPRCRRQGHGADFLRELFELARAAGRTKFGASWWETTATETFARQHGFARASQEICRRQSVRELPAGLVDQAYADAAPHARDYELIRLEGRTPDDLLPSVAALTAAINDAPLDELDIEDEVFPVERIRCYESATLDSGHRLHRIVARHRATGEPAGHTVVVVDTETPTQSHQHDTAVARAHRGHRLGLLLKAEMLRWLADAEPQVATIDTWNAESNAHMVAVNERLGYRAVGRGLEFQYRP